METVGRTPFVARFIVAGFKDMTIAKVLPKLDCSWTVSGLLLDCF